MLTVTGEKCNVKLQPTAWGPACVCCAATVMMMLTSQQEPYWQCVRYWAGCFRPEAQASSWLIFRVGLMMGVEPAEELICGLPV